MSLTIGSVAPDFSLTDTNKATVTLSELKGQKVVLLFFPFAFTGTCTTELCGVRDDIRRYSNLNAKVYGISIDSVFDNVSIYFSIINSFNFIICILICSFDNF